MTSNCFLPNPALKVPVVSRRATPLLWATLSVLYIFDKSTSNFTCRRQPSHCDIQCKCRSRI